jgi:predicted nucleic acid-binding protein
MIVISDTSPITNLIQIDCLDLLNAVFGKIIIPQTVYNELCELPDQKEILDNQDWISVVAAENRSAITQLETQLDKGEAEAIALAMELRPDFLIIDEIKGRTIAEGFGIKIVGLLGTLLKAKQLGHIAELKPKLEELIRLGFRVNPKLYDHILKLAGEKS